MERIPKPGEFYRHIENKLYQIIAVAEHTETGEDLVVYQALYGGYRIYAQPLSLFNRKADKRQYPKAQQEYYFEPVKFLADKQALQKLEDEEFFDEENEFEELNLEESYDEFFEEDYRDEEDEEGRDATQWLEYFLDARGYEKQLEILSQMRGKVGKQELDSICLVLGIPVLSGDDEDSQIANIIKHLETRMHYDTRRLR